MSIYKWPSSVIKECESILRNSLRNGDSKKKKVFSTAWKKVNVQMLKKRILSDLQDGSSLSKACMNKHCYGHCYGFDHSEEARCDLQITKHQCQFTYISRFHQQLMRSELDVMEYLLAILGLEDVELFTEVWISTYSSAASMAFNSDTIPWKLQAKWRWVKKQFVRPRITAVWREIMLETEGMEVGQGIKVCCPRRFMGEEKKLDVPGTPKDGTTSELQITQQQHEEQVMENASLHAPTLLEVGKRGDTPFVSIPAGEVAIGESQFKYSLIGRLDLQKVKFTDFQEYARNKWKISGQCKLIPLGKGFFIIKLDNEIDKIYVWSHGPWIVKKMPMRLMPWSPFFSVENHKNTNALIWCKFLGLPSELWSPKIVLSLGKTLGTPIQLDQSTLNHDYGYHASVLVDIVLSQPIPNHVFIDIEGKMINQEIILHRVPKFCNHCKNVGHCIAECNVIQRVFRGEQNQAPKNNKNPGIVKSKGKQDPPITEVPSKTEKNKKVQSTSPLNKHTYFTESTAGKGTSDMALGEWLAIKGRRGRSESPKSKTNVQLRDKESTNKYNALSEGDSVEQEKLTDMGMEEVKSQENLNNSNSKGVTQHSEGVNSGKQYSLIEEVRKLLNPGSWADIWKKKNKTYYQIK
ncbi:hypothetical protein GIB67_034673 [Kingdonia uniflora]|uniref:DUF4283 domain-containing protein n=1 Tax=Kingdonia uniflora TaxID=39325 RepID=A0A7J7P057_9MAGN|nr:hypothetical protein GIB67_034673 [Kingdonia uniflora]